MLIAYTIIYTNTGNQISTGTVITETVPANARFNANASTPGWSCADNSPTGTLCTLDVGLLITGYTASVVFAVTVIDPNALSVVSNTVHIGDDGTHGADLTPSNNTSSSAPWNGRRVYLPLVIR